MEKITSAAQLKEEILKLELKQATQRAELKLEIKNTVEKFKPVNLIKSGINDLLSSSKLKENLLNGVLGLAAGYLTKKAAVGSTNNPVKQVLGSLVQGLVTGLVTKNADGIKSSAIKIISTLLDKKEKEAI